MASLVKLPGIELWIEVNDVVSVSTSSSDSLTITLRSDKGRKTRAFTTKDAMVKAEKIVEFVNDLRYNEKST